LSEPRNALTARDSHIWTLRIALVIVSLVALGLVGILYSKQNDFFVHVPPDLSHGANIKPGELLAPNAYAFAAYIWRELNDWQEGGRKDYPKNIKSYQCYVTPSFLHWLEKNNKEKSAAGELERMRSLSVQDVFRDDMVKPIGGNTFEVTLTMQLHERIEGQPIKDIVIRYPFRVIPDTRSCNKMGMAIDGFFAQPERVQDEVK
jgi:integrating conjugative element protein (TIGR03746 family)